MKLELDRAEVLRYMGYTADGTDEQIIQTAQDAIDRITAAAIPRWRWVECGLDELPLSGKDIFTHLADCDRMIILCATLGINVDRTIRIAQRSSMLTALALDAAAGDAIEKVCDYAEDEMRLHYGERGLYLTGRYSPGYGDLPLTLQPDIITRCDAPRRIGLSVTPTNILTPRKSVTALLGVSAHPVAGRARGCGSCRLAAQCPYRKKMIHCGC